MQVLTDILEEGAAKFGDRTAIVFGEQSLTYSELLDAVLRLTARLQDLGIQPGDKIAFLDENSLEFPVVVFAVALAGAVFVPVNCRFGPDEIAYVVNDARPRLLLISEAYSPVVERAQVDFAGDVMVVDVPLVSTLLAAPDAPQPACPSIEPDSPAMVMYTSGTTGFPKGALLSHAAYIANINAIAAAGELSSDDRVMVSLPMFHNGGLIAVLMPALSLGALAVIMPRGFEPDAVLAAVERHRITATMWVPTMLSMLVNSKAIGSRDVSSLKKIWYGSSPIAPGLLEKVRAAFDADLYQFYGMTETGMTSVLTPDDHRLHPQGTGRQMDPAELRLVAQNGDDAPVGEVGELLSRQTPLGMTGYLGNEDETGKTVVDGWIHTGDMARNLGDGYFVIVDRKKDMIISGAENIYPREIEIALAAHPDVAEVAVFGIPDAVYGEAVCAAVIPAPGAALQPDDLVAWSASRLASYKKPKRVLLLDELPKNAAGKVLKHVLKAPFWRVEKRAI